jgi:transposase
MEEWRAVLDWEGFYEVSNAGGIRSLDRTYRDRWGNLRAVAGRPIKPGRDTDGYPIVPLIAPGRRKTRTVHQLVLESFRCRRPASLQARHLNGVKTDCRLANLEWSTSKVNIGDKRTHGTQTRGADIRFSKLTEDLVLQIIASANIGKPRKLIAAEFGVDAETIRHICKGYTWKHLKVARPGNRKMKPKLTDDQVREIRRRLNSGEKEQALGREFGLAWRSVNLIRRGITYAGVTCGLRSSRGMRREVPRWRSWHRAALGIDLEGTPKP